MFGPYRTPPEMPPEPLPERSPEEVVLGGGMVVLGAIRVLVAVLTTETWGAEPALALLLLVGGFVILMRRS